VPVLILSTETSPVVAARARKLGIPVLHGLSDKASALAGWLREACELILQSKTLPNEGE